MGTCKNCKFWSMYISPREYTPPYLGTCAQAKGEHSEFRAYSALSDVATLQTNPDFGCNQFSPKD